VNVEVTNLPFFHLFLLRSVLSQQIIQDLLQAFGIRFQCRDNIRHCPFYQNTIDHTKAFPILLQWFQRFEHEPKQRRTTVS